MTINDNRCQSMSINRLILVIDVQSIAHVSVIIDCHRLSISLITNINRSLLLPSEPFPAVSCSPASKLASYADALWARHAFLLHKPKERLRRRLASNSICPKYTIFADFFNLMQTIQRMMTLLCQGNEN